MIDVASLADWLVDASFKASVVGLVILALQALLGRRLPARWKHALWLLVVLRLFMPAVPQSPLSLFNLLPSTRNPVPATFQDFAGAPESAKVAALNMAPRRAQPSETRSPWVPALFAGWALVALALIARHLFGTIAMNRRLAAENTSEYAWLTAALERAAGETRIRRTPQIAVTDGIESPALLGLLRPRILIPRELSDVLDDEELRHVLLHELSHLRRGDAWINALVALATSLHWFNPLVWLAAARIREERELVCDELALSFLEEEERDRYGRTLLRLLSRFRAPAAVPALVGIVDPRKYMKRRIEMIASYRKSRSLSGVFAVLVAGVAAVGFTDARAGERIQIRKGAQSHHVQIEKLHARSSFTLNNASITDLIGAVSNETGTIITLGADAAQSEINAARFDVEAKNAPAFMILTEALQEFDLAPVPAEDGTIHVTAAPEPEMVVARIEAGRASEHDVVQLRLRKEAEAARGGERIVIRKEMSGTTRDGIDSVETSNVERRVIHAEATSDVDGETARKTFDFSFDDNGVKSQGSLRLEIRNVR